jgi:hypothetical protein
VLLAAVLSAAPGRLSPVLAASAALACLGRLLMAARAARHCLAMRAMLR